MRHHNIVCGGLKIPKKLQAGEMILLDVQGQKNVELKIDSIHKATASNISDELLDLLEIGAYVYCADQQIKRGSDILTDYGADWRRSLHFTIPVRKPDLWNSPELRQVLEETLGFLADDSYHFSFERAIAPPANKTQYFEFSKEGVEPDEVALFSGGVDSFAGAVEGIVGNHKKMVLVGHHSANQVKSVQVSLIDEFIKRGHKGHIQYISVEVRNSGISAAEYTQRTRSFLFACLAVGIAHLLGKDRFTFYENGVISLNLPITKDILGGRATRTTHPRVINGFREIFSLALGKSIAIDHPFQWLTKKEVTQRISQHKYESLIGLTNSCTRPREFTKKTKHCGACSQCIDRRFAILAAGMEAHDPADYYKIDLLTGDRTYDKEIVMATSYVKFAQQFSTLSKDQFISEHPQIASALREFDGLTTAKAEERIFQLYQRHSKDVLDVLSMGMDVYRDRLLQGSLINSCLLATSFNRNQIQAATPSGYDDQMRDAIDNLAAKRCQFYVDTSGRQILFKGGYAIKGTNYNLVAALLDNFRNGRSLSEGAAYITSENLAKTLGIEEPNIRTSIMRFRSEITPKLAIDQGIILGTHDFIENAQGKGYRLHPRLKEVSALSDLDD